MCVFVIGMRRIEQGDQDIYVEERHSHDSSRNRFTSSM